MAFTVPSKLDDAALYIGLLRIPGETDEAFFSRIRRMSDNPYGITYKDSTRSISEQCGIKLLPIARLSYDNPYTININNEYVIFETENSITKIFINTPCPIMHKVRNILTRNSDIQFTILDDELFDTVTRETIYRISNAYNRESIITGQHNRLDCDHIYPGSLTLEDKTYNETSLSIQDIYNNNEYYVDYNIGYIYFKSTYVNPMIVRYTEYSNVFIFYKAEFNLLQIDSYIKHGISDNFTSIIKALLNGRALGE